MSAAEPERRTEPPGPSPDLLLGADPAHLFLWKPPGLPVFPPHADPAGDCLLARVLARWPERGSGWPEGFEGGIAHRLDTATSGLVIAARAPEHLGPLRDAFRSGELRKFYLFRSSAPGTEGVVDLPIAHHPRRRDKMVVARAVGRTTHRGRWYPAWTRFRRLGGGWWEAEMNTGVMHQIRVHAAAAGMPLDGDPLYGGTDGPRVLHASHVQARGWASVVAPLPPGVGSPG